MDSMPSIRDRVFSVADRLYQETERQTFPTVDAVRKASKVNMNDASTLMREWRRAQTSRIEPVTVQVPARLQQASATALATLWSEATALANEALRAAEGVWEAERAESDAIREQMAAAFETQAEELASSQTETAQLRIERAEVQAQMADIQRHLKIALQDAATAATAMREARARAEEIELRANDLRGELDKAHRNLDNANQAIKESHGRHHADVKALREQLDRQRQESEQTMTLARDNLAHAREEAAALRGRLEALEQPTAGAKGTPQEPAKSNGKKRAD